MRPVSPKSVVGRYSRCVRHRVPAICLGLGLLAWSPSSFAAPVIEKEKLGPVPTETNLSRDDALRVLAEGEQLLQQEMVVEALTKMLEAYIALEESDGPEASGVRELRSWLVKALETLEMVDEAKVLRARGSYVDHPLSVMPSTWFVAQQPTEQLSLDEATQAVETGLNMLQEGNIDGLGLLFAAHETCVRELGAESEEAKVIRSFLVGLLEVGGFTDEANNLRAQGSVTPATAEDNEVYAATWLRIIGAEDSADSVFGTESSSSLKPSDTSSSTSNDSGPSTLDTSSSDDSSSWDDSSDDDEDYDYKPKVLQKGSAVPSLLIDIGIGTFQPEYGRKGLLWTAGLEAHWTLFTAKFFGMRLGGGGAFGRNRNKRWYADAHGELQMSFDFDKLYLRPEFGGGYDQLAGGDEPIAVAYHVAPAAYYHFGGALGVRFGEQFGMYARAVRLNRNVASMRNETRLRAGFIYWSDEVGIDFAFVFTDYDAREGQPGARIFGGNIGLRI